MNVLEYKKKSMLELQQLLKDLLRQQFKLRLKKSTGDLKKTDQVKQVRRDIARIMTILTEKKVNNDE